ncbi:MAG: ABC transporter permease, partial [Firmicutes bacterium]|nr:ABC transporter permease [Bacillota bacterium]
MKEKRSLYDILKQADEKRAQEELAAGERLDTLDSTERVKVLSPARLVSKRFFRNRLAMVGLGILIFMFAFAFLGPIPYPFSQTALFYNYKPLSVDYAMATERTEYVSYAIPGAPEVPSTVISYINSYITAMKTAGETTMDITDSSGTPLRMDQLGEGVYTLSAATQTPVATYYGSTLLGTYNAQQDAFAWNAGTTQSDAFQSAVRDAVKAGNKSFSYNGDSYTVAAVRKNQYSVTRSSTSIQFMGGDLGADFRAAVEANLKAGSFTFGDQNYKIVSNGDGSYTIAALGDMAAARVASTLVFNALNVGQQFSDSFKAGALLAVHGSGAFTDNGAAYTVKQDAGGNLGIFDSADNQVVMLGNFAIRRYSGDDTLSLDFKLAAQAVVENMQAQGLLTSTFTFKLPQLDDQAKVVTDENGNVTYVDTEIKVTHKPTGEYVMTCNQTTKLIAIFAPPGSRNILGNTKDATPRLNVFGTDGDGMDVLARVMYGGRISLIVGFVVVFLEIVLGAIMGGLAGFFGGWVDTLIMRLCDIFFCIPQIPVLIILGALFDKLKLDPYTRIIWMMVVLGVLYWAYIARLIRGQILSLREQEFMVAQEATGMPASKRIFKHLIPNVLPLIIVQATLDLGAIIILESTLSFLGLGVKRPMASWGSIINGVTGSPQDMVKYAYIWVPVGLLICLSVIAFNFVGDGLRDAFDPKS